MHVYVHVCIHTCINSAVHTDDDHVFSTLYIELEKTYDHMNAKHKSHVVKLDLLCLSVHKTNHTTMCGYHVSTISYQLSS